jgi:antitoxin CcdA
MGEPEKVEVELDAETLEAASSAGLDFSRVLTEALRRKLLLPLDPAERERVAQQWYEENKASVDWYNRLVEEHGLFSGGIRMF